MDPTFGDDTISTIKRALHVNEFPKILTDDLEDMKLLCDRAGIGGELHPHVAVLLALISGWRSPRKRHFWRTGETQDTEVTKTKEAKEKGTAPIGLSI